MAVKGKSRLARVKRKQRDMAKAVARTKRNIKRTLKSKFNRCRTI